MSESTSLAGVHPAAPSLKERAVGGHPRVAWPAVALGAAAAGAVLALRYAGVLEGPAAIAVAVACCVLAPGPRRVADRFVVLFALGVGWLPLLGWIPRLSTAIDVPGVVLALAVGVVCADQLADRRGRPRTVAAPTPAELVALGLGGAVALWWGRPFVGMGPSGILRALMQGWDNNGHFAMLQQNLQLGSFVQARPALRGGAARLGYDYPQGMHQAWAQLARLVAPHATVTVPWLLHAYVVLVVATAGGIVALCCTAVARGARHDLVVALPAMALVVALFATGRLGPFNGFPNYELAIAAGAVAVTLCVRATMGPLWTFAAVAGLCLVVAYNWFPIVVVAAPAVVLAALRAHRSVSGRARVGLDVALGATALALAAPLQTFSHRGVSFLNAAGTLIGARWGLVVISAAAVVCLAVLGGRARADRATNLVVGATGALGGAAVLVVAAYEVRTTGAVSYYGQKLAEGVLGACVVVFACVAASDVAASASRRRLARPIAVGACALVAVAALQLDGYVGPDYGALGGTDVATGLAVHDLLAGVPDRSAGAAQLIEAARVARRSRAAHPAEQWWFVDPTPLPGHWNYIDPEQLAQWFPVLRGDPTDSEYYVSLLVVSPQLLQVHSPSAAARMLLRDFPDPIADHVHLFVPPWLRAALVREDTVWGRPGVLHLIPAPVTR